VRELRNVIERAVVLADDGRIGPEMLHLSSAAGGLIQEEGVPIHLPYKQAMKQMRTRCQAEHVRAVLEKCNGNVTRAADYAGIERESFHRLMRKCKVSRDDVKAD
jgi:DNA-binding NtrC family response regulator